jgi:protocatechuate 3,4-dioxygenase alpha subunit
MSSGYTPSQTVGPYLHIGLDWLNTTELVASDSAGERCIIQGQLRDADGLPIPDGMIEIWQANSHGKYAHPLDNRDLPIEKSFTGFGRAPTDGDGRFRFSTIKPGRVPALNGTLQAPHILVAIFARGLIKQLVTRIYFPGDDHAADQVMLQVPVERRATLIAKAIEDQPGVLEWNIAIGGGVHETVFFEL